MQNEIIEKIASFLDNNLEDINRSYDDCEHEDDIPNWLNDWSSKIYATIAPLVAEKDLPLSELFTHMSEQHDLTLTDTELVDIIQVARKGAPLVEAGSNNEWSNAPDWAQWLASNNKGLSQWFEDKPIWDEDIQMWCESTEDGRYKFAGKLAKVKELKQRP